MTLRRRVAKIETSLTPKQAVLEWVEKAQEFASFADYLADLAEAPWFASPRVEVPNRVGAAVLNVLKEKGAKEEAVARAVLQAQKRTHFLVALVVQVNVKVFSESYKNFLSVELLAEQRARMGEQFDRYGSFDPEEWEWWRRILLANLSRMLRQQAAIAAISTKYYSGHRILFEEQKAELDGCIEKADLLARVYNARKGWLPCWTAMDLAALRRDVETRVPATMRELVDSTKSEILLDFGKPRAAWGIIQAHVLSSSRCSRSSDLSAHSPW
jgi:hypothetical protein